jgi:hypothetical protein
VHVHGSLFMTMFPRLLLAFSALAIALSPHTACAGEAGVPHIVIERHKPCNLFSTQEPVVFSSLLKGFAVGKVDAVARIADYDGKDVWEKTYPVEMTAQSRSPLDIDAGPLPRGYYELTLTSGGASTKATFVVIDFINRTAAEVRDGSYAFGLKWWDGVTDKRECEDAMCKAGFQWTRIVQNQKGDLTTAQMLTEFPMNAVIKIERFPKELFDTARYGPLDEWEKKYGRGAWTLKTMPQKQPFQELLRQQLAAIPPEQKVFEIWNEPWDKMAPEDFATLCQWVAEVVLKDRPDAVLGPNLLGNTSPYEYDARVIKAGGLKGMKMVALHPYATSENRAWLRGYRDWLKQQLGHDMDIYVTEFGSHSTPQGPSARTEQEQARRVVRQALSLYAEGVKAFMPHWLGQTEQNPVYIEDWFGFLRKNEQPKPVFAAYANSAQLVDGSLYVGDIWYGPGVSAMLFRQKNGTDILALYTLGDGTSTATPQKTIEIQTGAPELTLVDMVGREKKISATGGKASLTLTDSPCYLVGIGADLEKQASKELRPDQWPKPPKPPRVTRTAHFMATPPSIDGTWDSWKNMLELGLSNPKVAGDDASGTGYIGWDKQFLYVGVNMRDNELLNVQPRSKLYSQDSVELFLSLVPRDTGSGFGPDDHQFILAPTSGEGKPIAGEVKDRGDGTVVDIPGDKLFAGKVDKGWIFQVAIPWSALPNFKPDAGAKAALEMRVNDADTSHPRFKIDPVDVPGEALNPNDPSTWSYLDLEN